MLNNGLSISLLLLRKTSNHLVLGSVLNLYNNTRPLLMMVMVVVWCGVVWCGMCLCVYVCVCVCVCVCGCRLTGDVHSSQLMPTLTTTPL